MSAPRQIAAIAAAAYLVGLALGGAYWLGVQASACQAVTLQVAAQ